MLQAPLAPCNPGLNLEGPGSELGVPDLKKPQDAQETVGEEFPGDLVVKEMSLSLLGLRFYPWPGNFYMLLVQKKKRKKERKKERKGKKREEKQ